ncbi:hypothetical protein BKA70DRAFT_1428531 [Coprinopsis sp. MPI-PUGE-AT-0042]|nr:hypothetical protein BKA70DRAFT_1428531 [Coprinopsis sp. MPI-PUGE-AT-0042]
MVGIDLFPRTSSVSTDYCTPEGQVIYRVEARSQWNRKTITIRKVVSGTFDNRGDPALKDEFVEIGRIELRRFSTHTICFPEKTDTTSRERLASNARDESNTNTNMTDLSCWESGGLGAEMRVSDVFKRGGWPKIESLVFNGPDGRSYDWVIGPFLVKLHSNDDSGIDETQGALSPIAEFPYLVTSDISTASAPQPIGDRTRREARTSFHVTAKGQHLIDYIFVSFVYAETIRRKQEPAMNGRAKEEIEGRFNYERVIDGSGMAIVAASTGGVKGAHPQKTHSPGVWGGHVTEYPGGQGGHGGGMHGVEVLDGAGVRVGHGGIVNRLPASRIAADAATDREYMRRVTRRGYCFIEIYFSDKLANLAISAWGLPKNFPIGSRKGLLRLPAFQFPLLFPSRHGLGLFIRI